MCWREMSGWICVRFESRFDPEFLAFLRSDIFALWLTALPDIVLVVIMSLQVASIELG